MKTIPPLVAGLILISVGFLFVQSLFIGTDAVVSFGGTETSTSSSATFRYAAPVWIYDTADGTLGVGQYAVVPSGRYIVHFKDTTLIIDYHPDDFTLVHIIKTDYLDYFTDGSILQSPL